MKGLDESSINWYGSNLVAAGRTNAAEGSMSFGLDVRRTGVATSSVMRDGAPATATEFGRAAVKTGWLFAAVGSTRWGPRSDTGLGPGSTRAIAGRATGDAPIGEIALGAVREAKAE